MIAQLFQIQQLAQDTFMLSPILNTAILGFILYKLFNCSNEIAALKVEVKLLQKELNHERNENDENEGE